MKENHKSTLAKLPDAPGVYKFSDKNGTLIYVGKAKNLKKRVSSYFSKQSSYNRKTEKMVEEIASIDYTISNTEFDALLLENNFIKQYQPRYNILLKDDKTFPYLCILRERFPRIIYTRKYLPEQGEYFGPYSSVVAMKSVLDLIRQLYSIRTCSFLLSEENIRLKKFKVCLEYHIGNCKGPCEGKQEEAEYNEEISMARSILKGNLSQVEHYFKEHMASASKGLEFEKADFYKQKIDLLEKFQSKSMVVNKKLSDIDVITISSTLQKAFVNYLQLREGAIIHSQNLEISKKLDEEDREILTSSLFLLREKSRSANTMVFSNIPLTVVPDTIENLVPLAGDKKKVVDLSLKNAWFIKMKQEEERTGRKAKETKILEELQASLRLKSIPAIMECFDNSNLQGTSPVASMVRFVNGRPDKKGYRHFNIKTVTGPDDFASMKEIVGRRYKRIIEEKGELPDLIVIDGGKGQLASACEALKDLGIYSKVAVIGIAKKLEEIYLPEDSVPQHLSKKSQALKLIQQIRDEAHRFAVTFHRLKRSKNAFTNPLENISGIGPTTAKKLFSRFKSMKKIMAAPHDEIVQLIGFSKAKALENGIKKGLD